MEREELVAELKEILKDKLSIHISAQNSYEGSVNIRVSVNFDGEEVYAENDYFYVGDNV